MVVVGENWQREMGIYTALNVVGPIISIANDF